MDQFNSNLTFCQRFSNSILALHRWKRSSPGRMQALDGKAGREGVDVGSHTRGKRTFCPLFLVIRFFYGNFLACRWLPSLMGVLKSFQLSLFLACQFDPLLHPPALPEPFPPQLQLTADSSETPKKRPREGSDPVFLVEACPTKSPKCDPKLLSQAQELARSFKGQCLSPLCCGQNQPLLYQCALGHTWKSNRVLRGKEWCRKCGNKLRKAQQWAAEHGGQLLSTIVEQTVTFCCAQGHQWTEDIERYMNRKWCKDCRTHSKVQAKAQAKLDEETQQRARELLQQQLFQQARQAQGPASPAEKSLAYLQSAGASGSYEEALSVYSLISMSQEDLVATCFKQCESRDQVTRRFRLLARTVHPDKNRHPQAQEAFVALMRGYSQVVTSIAA